ncbi:zeta toxin family protein [Lysobacter capsici]|uniref:zeta toxin family protein n=1 Tax=Lysobacter capsici TaxID=435897 RepID=UPI0009E455F6|nr:zeta toxin family protein [Lysobacter capsici]
MSQDQLDSQEHSEIFTKKILTSPQFKDAYPQEHPRAVILAGQPGAGKGGLADLARQEMGLDAVTVDPDDLRRFHSNIDQFRQQTPYNWSGRTHPDASQWADELREATVSSKKNLIFDTTLSNGQWSSDLIKDLQSKGYEVEVRAIAAHRLESELGVDRRFTDKLDAEGFGATSPKAPATPSTTNCPQAWTRFTRRPTHPSGSSIAKASNSTTVAPARSCRVPRWNRPAKLD